MVTPGLRSVQNVLITLRRWGVLTAIRDGAGLVARVIVLIAGDSVIL